MVFLTEPILMCHKLTAQVMLGYQSIIWTCDTSECGLMDETTVNGNSGVCVLNGTLQAYIPSRYRFHKQK